MPSTHSHNLLVLDIDETLLHADDAPRARGACDFYVFDYGVVKRPGVDAFLRWCFASRDTFHTSVWTAGTEDYADAILAHLLAPAEIAALDFVWARDRCSRVLRSVMDDDGYDPDRWELLKDLTKLRRAGYDLDHVLHLDNTPSVARRNYGNLVHIPSFIAAPRLAGDAEDTYLERVQPRLLEWFAAPSVRTIDKRGWWRT